MTLVRYERPFGLFRDFFSDYSVASMKTDIKETDEAYIVEAEMPGVKKENVELVCEKGVLTVSAKASEEKTEETGYIRRERTQSSMVRRFEIEGVDEENISAKMEDGILTVTLPKSAESKEKRIEIE